MLRLENVQLQYGKRRILEDVNLKFGDGLIASIIGVNGSGKSTLLRVCAGRLAPGDGQVFLGEEGVGEKPLFAYPPKELAKRIAILPQSRPIPQITAEKLVSHGRFPHMGFPRRLSEEDQEAVERAMELTGTTSFRRRPLTALSGGERQKVYLAMIIAQETPFILLDEPTTYLDIPHQEDIMELLAELKKKGRTILMVLHDIGQALEHSDRVCLLEQGRPPVLRSPQDPELIQRIESTYGIELYENRLPGDIRKYAYVRRARVL